MRKRFRERDTFSRCFSSPREKLSISSAFLRSTVPLVSVCAMSRAEANTGTLALVAFVIIPARPGQEGWKIFRALSHLLAFSRTPYPGRHDYLKDCCP